jgi:hypothetical protein
LLVILLVLLRLQAVLFGEDDEAGGGVTSPTARLDVPGEGGESVEANDEVASSEVESFLRNSGRNKEVEL